MSLRDELQERYDNFDREKDVVLEVKRENAEKYNASLKEQPFNKFVHPIEELENRISVIKANPVQTIKDQKLLLKLQAELEKLKAKTEEVDEKIEDFKFDGDGMHYNEKRNNVYLLKRPKRILIQ